MPFMTTPSEQTYTLSEARDLIAREICMRNGHDYDVISTRDMADPAGQPVTVSCGRCHRHWAVSPRP